MKYLVICACGHSLDLHEAPGCRGLPGAPCECERDPAHALDTAIDKARDEAGAWRRVESSRLN